MKNFSATALDDMSVEQIAKLDPADLAVIDAELELDADVTARRQAKVNEAKARKWATLAAQARQSAGKDTGTIRLSEGGYQIVCGLSKRVKWDQGALKTALDSLSPEDARHFAKVEIKIDERKFDAAPASIRNVLAVARTVETGKPTFTIEPKAQEAA